MKNKMPNEIIVKFYKKYFTEMRDELIAGEELTLIPDDNFSVEDNEVIYYLEFNCIMYSNEEILEMIDS
jgi:hypothetical protein